MQCRLCDAWNVYNCFGFAHVKPMIDEGEVGCAVFANLPLMLFLTG